jgi:Family of unknown function (DUF6882)
MKLEELYDRSAAIAWVRQRRLRARIADHIWWVDPQNGIARLYTRDRQQASGDLRVQIVGSEAASGHWMWEWANPLNAVPPAARTAADRLRALGRAHTIDELVEPRVDCDQLVNADTLASIALAVCDAPGYFLHVVRPLRVAILLDDESFRTPEDTSLVNAANAVNEVVGAGLPLSNARDVIAGFLTALHVEHHVDDDGTIHASTEAEAMRVTFDGPSYEFKVRTK